jgi:hypothetical protein
MGKYAIMLVMVLNFAVMSYVLTIGRNSVAASTNNTESYSYSQARAIAQSVAQLAVAKIMDEGDSEFNPSAGSAFNFPNDGVSFSPWTELNGEYRLHIENQDDTLLVVQAIGRHGDEEYPVNINFTFDGSGGGSQWPEMDMAVFSEGSINMSGSARIQGNIGTNSVQPQAMNLNLWNFLPADTAFAGVGSNPDEVILLPGNPGNNEAAYNMVKDNLDEERSYPLPLFPEFPNFGLNLGTITTNWPNTHINLNPADYDNKYFDEIKVVSGWQITFHVGDGNRRLRVNNLNVKTGAINIVGDGTLTIYVDDDFALDYSGEINRSGETDQFFMFYKGSPKVSVDGATLYNGGMYVENADVEIGGSGGVAGHIVSGGSRVDVSGAATVNYKRVIYAPHAHVEISGSGATGAVVSNTFNMSGGTFLQIPHNEDNTNEYDSELPELIFEGTGGNEIQIASWN